MILPTTNEIILNPLLGVCEQGFHVNALFLLTQIVSEDEVVGFVNTFATSCVVAVPFSWRRGLPSSSLWAVCSTVWHCWHQLPLSFELLLCFLACSFNPRRLCLRYPFPFRTPKLKPTLRVATFAGITLFSQRQLLFVFAHTASEDGAVACTREILVFSRPYHS